ncbi:hypothetical protein PMAYCL1PPCAC_05302 [Pristionchus mayeri]|uniref:Uncharacterized protein n=1 Tax=Pristionchus mayeri TaxID=1317129 RepID=A0AAN4Z5X4_9BILA|nr:hypothetical protein PMAYCL1PPCAC_05302 [Pristionchus mayeri]
MAERSALFVRMRQHKFALILKCSVSLLRIICESAMCSPFSSMNGSRLFFPRPNSVLRRSILMLYSRQNASTLIQKFDRDEAVGVPEN